MKSPMEQLGGTGGMSPPPLSFRTNFEICLNPLINCRVTLIRVHGQLIICNLITEDTGLVFLTTEL
jgi:hypothetical protein